MGGCSVVYSQASSLGSPLDGLGPCEFYRRCWLDIRMLNLFFSIALFVSCAAALGLIFRFHLAYPPHEPDIPDHSCYATADNQDRKVPQCAVAKSCACAENDEYSCYFVSDCFLGQLYSSQRNDSNGTSVETGEQSVYNGREALRHLLYAE